MEKLEQNKTKQSKAKQSNSIHDKTFLVVNGFYWNETAQKITRKITKKITKKKITSNNTIRLISKCIQYTSLGKLTMSIANSINYSCIGHHLFADAIFQFLSTGIHLYLHIFFKTLHQNGHSKIIKKKRTKRKKERKKDKNKQAKHHNKTKQKTCKHPNTYIKKKKTKFNLSKFKLTRITNCCIFFRKFQKK